MKAGIVIPLPQEVKPLTQTRLRVGQPFLLSNQIYLIHSGVGEQHAKHAAKVILRQQIDILISWGTCVSLVPELKTGDLILPQQVLDHQGNSYQTDSLITGKLKSLLHAEWPVHEGRLHGVRHMIADPAQKRSIAATTGAIAADMESGVLAHIAQEQKLAFVAIRAVSDTMNMQIPNAVIHGVNAFGEVQWSSFLIHLIRRPDQIPAMTGLVQGLWRAQAALAQVGKYLPEILYELRYRDIQ